MSWLHSDYYAVQSMNADYNVASMDTMAYVSKLCETEDEGRNHYFKYIFEKPEEPTRLVRLFIMEDGTHRIREVLEYWKGRK